MSVLLRAEGVRHAYGARRVLSLDHLEVRQGETLCIMGPNGAGKSTLVRILNLVETAAQGTVWFDGRRVSPRSLAARRRMAGVFQQPHMFRGSVLDNVAYGMRLRRRSRDEIAAHAGEALELMGLTGLARRDARSLSQGEKQKVALARAIAVRPELLFLDEPAAGLDPEARGRFQLDLRRVVRELGATVVYVTHSFTEALATGDRLAVMTAGEVRQAGPAHEVFQAPSDVAAARFLGFENLLPGRVVGDAAGAVVELEQGGRVYTRSRLAGQVAVCLRGEDITLHPECAADDISPTANRFPAEVVSLEQVGAVFRTVLDCGFMLKTTQARPAVRSLGLVPGARVEARFDEEAAHLVACPSPDGELLAGAPRPSGSATGERPMAAATEDEGHD